LKRDFNISLEALERFDFQEGFHSRLLKDQLQSDTQSKLSRLKNQFIPSYLSTTVSPCVENTLSNASRHSI